MSWQLIIVVLWVFSVLIYVFVKLLFVRMEKMVLVEAMKEVALFYLAEKAKWIDSLEKKFGKGSNFSSVV